MRSTFSGLSMALLGLNASQKALDVTGQNITNINTSGYTRQRLDQSSISPSGASYFNMVYGAKVGQGVMVTGVSQIRDPFLDIQYRNQLTKVGTEDAKNEILKGIGDVFDNVDVSTIQDALDDVVDQLQVLSTKVGQKGNDNLVRSSFEVLLSYIHQNATDLKKVRTELETKMSTTVVPEVNQILSSIQKLNDSIKASQVQGNPALELKDQRNTLLDDLATYLPIDVVYGTENVGGGFNVETLSIKLRGVTDAGGADVYLVKDGEKGDFSYSTVDGKGKLEYTGIGGGAALDLTDKLPSGILKGNLDMMNKEGAFDGSTVKGIGYYEKMFDSFVNTLATEMNKLNSQYAGVAGAGNLFEATGGGTITASNIKISDGWMNGTVKLIASEHADVEGNTDPDNILKMKALLSTDTITFYALDKDGNRLTDAGGNEIVVFKGTMPAAYANIQAEQGIEKKSTQAILNNHTTVLANAADARDSVMGVNLDEEVMNLMRYQQSYGAAARLMTVMDEALDKLINDTGMVGR